MTNSPNVIPLKKLEEETFKVSPSELIGSIVKKEDFAVINGKIEPTRDLMLKLSTIAKASEVKSQLVNVIPKDNKTIYIVKATITLSGRTAEAHGACDTSEISNRSNSRIEHDALATAETRALKRAFESAVGLPFINEIILQLFGSYEMPEEAPQITPEEFIRKIKEAKALPHLKNIWRKYSKCLKGYSEEDKARVIREKDLKKEELKLKNENA